MKLKARSVYAMALAIGIERGSPVSIAIQGRGAPYASIVEAVADVLARLGGDSPFCSTMQALVVTARVGAV